METNKQKTKMLWTLFTSVLDQFINKPQKIRIFQFGKKQNRSEEYKQKDENQNHEEWWFFYIAKERDHFFSFFSLFFFPFKRSKKEMCWDDDFIWICNKLSLLLERYPLPANII